MIGAGHHEMARSSISRFGPAPSLRAVSGDPKYAFDKKMRPHVLVRPRINSLRGLFDRDSVQHSRQHSRLRQVVPRAGFKSEHESNVANLKERKKAGQ